MFPAEIANTAVLVLMPLLLLTLFAAATAVRLADDHTLLDGDGTSADITTPTRIIVIIVISVTKAPGTLQRVSSISVLKAFGLSRGACLQPQITSELMLEDWKVVRKHLLCLNSSTLLA